MKYDSYVPMLSSGDEEEILKALEALTGLDDVAYEDDGAIEDELFKLVHDTNPVIVRRTIDILLVIGMFHSAGKGFYGKILPSAEMFQNIFETMDLPAKGIVEYFMRGYSTSSKTTQLPVGLQLAILEKFKNELSIDEVIILNKMQNS